MTHKFKSLLSFIIFLFLFSSCEKDFYEDIDLQKKQIKEIDIKTITYEDFSRKMQVLKNKPAVKMIMNKANSSLTNHNARTGDDSDIEIYTDIIKEITSGTYKSYTMYIKTSDTIASRFYNLTLEEKEGNTDAFITKYSPTENWLNDKNQPFEGGITTFRAEPGPGGSIKFTHVDEEGGGAIEGSNIYPIACDGTVQTTIIVEAIMCSEYVHWPWSPTTPPCDANVKARYKYTYRYECVPGITFPGSGGSNPGGSSSVGGGSTPGGSNNTSEPPGLFNEDGSITSPILTNSEVNHIKELKKITNQNENGTNGLRNYIDQLAANTDNPIEQGMEFKLNSNGTYSAYPAQSNGVDGTGFPPVSVNNPIIRMHKHHTGLNPIFSAEDVLGMVDFFIQKNNLNPNSPENNNITFIMVSEDGVHALRVSNPIEIEEFNSYYSTRQAKLLFRGAYEKKVIKKSQNECNGTCTNEEYKNLLLQNFIAFFKEMVWGIDFYYAPHPANNNDNYNWTKQN
ncbi:hypothetical protein M0M57_04860 [Flavobacterium azooxidireducens]|uniref:Uncharacterized protein n=1 Tax=Flavobacterium azooxidireducens TaxID=1871076 RepID=A0ABY4KH65_9FLAO|nr:hypothetical protein [Flavobacterium azooxidireducens]UPQ80166.1 hypothetical protein M0M57_04860 [Flavobacterium azooxidireducens]